MKKRKFPAIQKSKLNVPSVFGNTSKIFGAESKANEPPTKSNDFKAAARRPPPPPRKLSFDERETDTKLTETLKRLQVNEYW